MSGTNRHAGMVVALLLALLAGSAQAQAPSAGFSPDEAAPSAPTPYNWAPTGPQAAPAGVDAQPTGQISYQGRLYQGGTPMNGSLAITFRLYLAASAGSAFWTETQTVNVQNGLFNVMLGAVQPLTASATAFWSQVWLGVQPAGAAAELTPRQPLGAVGYAMGVIAGATMVDTSAAGGYAYAFWIDSGNHEGIYSRSGTGSGVYGVAAAASQSGVKGSASGTDGHGVAGISSGGMSGCVGSDAECVSGVFGSGTSTTAYGGFFNSSNASAVIATGANGTYYQGWFYNRATGTPNGLYTNGSLVVGGYATFGGGKSGFVVDIALNDGDVPLEQGDVVAISGVAAPEVGNVPVARVQRATAATGSAVMGVVDVLYEPCRATEPLQAGQACGGFRPDVKVINPGQFLAVVTLGAYMGIKADATMGPIQPGDLLSAGSAGGKAAKAKLITVDGASFYAPGTIVGKALGSLDSGTGLVPVFVSLK